jgi:hypothetical protein
MQSDVVKRSSEVIRGHHQKKPSKQEAHLMRDAIRRYQEVIRGHQRSLSEEALEARGAP